MARPKQFNPEVAVEEAMRVFWDKGYARTTPQDLVDALGIGKGSLYNTFGSKRQLFDLALQRYQRYQRETIGAIVDRPGPAKDRLRAAFDYLVRTNLDGTWPRGCLAVNTATELSVGDAPAAEQVARSFDRTESAIRALLVEGRATGELSPDLDPDQCASMLLAVTMGIQVAARMGEDRARLDRIVDGALASL